MDEVTISFLSLSFPPIFHTHFHVQVAFTVSTKDRSGPGSAVSIATAYGLDGPGIDSRWGEIFRTSPDRP